MRRRMIVIAVGAMCALGTAVFIVTRSAPATKAAAPVVATVQVESPTERTLLRTLAAFGDVAPGRTVGISFPRAGQLALLDVYPGKRVARGAVLARLSPDPSTVQAWDQAVTAMRVADRERHRLEELLALQLATRSQVDAATKAFRDAEGAVKELEATGGGAGESVATAPFDGVVVAVPTAQGDRIAAGAPVLQLGHVDALRVRIGIEPADAGRVRVGTPVTLQPLVGVNDRADPIAAQVAELQDVVDPATQLVNAVVVLQASRATGLVPGMKVRATLTLDRVAAVAVRRDALLDDERGTYVYAIRGGKARRVDVKPGIASDGYVAVDGLPAGGDPVAIVGNAQLADGMDVRVTKESS